MANMELKLREFGQPSKRKASGSMLQRHKPASSMLFDEASFAGDRSSLMTAHAGIRAKASRLIIKQRLGKDELKMDVLPPPPMGKSFGHGLIANLSEKALY
jgi:hypothetical protein